ncbi:hypothetical protein SAPIO_CDS5238 [Scedosporium apiospermum]|uniref:BZIP domain-containing protein n=1 Tax=Pseudallescheria apiosperma TaxID=563466 RepID=A0A084G658_PSEDA|nr:uncharacterized protein SAPIO_CDS5238 [Scedosporium apiospermum]KEZ42820.1 hypothetical protein SAPIO_CDS5238 [Scedosporium apiospermum]
MAPRRSALYSLLNEGSSEHDMMSESDINSGNTSDVPISTPPSRSNSRVPSNSPSGLRTPASYPHAAADHMEASPHIADYGGAAHPHASYASTHQISYSSPVPRLPGAPGAYHHGMHPGGLPPISGLQGPMVTGDVVTAPHMASLNKPVEDMFLVRIDTYTASKEAGDKRQKNADASARYRRRKADQAAEEKSKMAQLQEENRYLGGRVIELTRQREFYRSERQALRELMLTVPELKEVAKNRPATPLPPYDEQ